MFSVGILLISHVNIRVIELGKLDLLPSYGPPIVWEVAQPVVQDYINKSVGPKALLNDIIKTGKVMARFGPKLPKLMEAFLNDQANSSKQKQTNENTGFWHAWCWVDEVF